MAGLSLEMPIKTLIEIMNIDIHNLEKEEYTVKSYSEFFNSVEIHKLYTTMIHFVNNIKYSNNKLWDIETSEALTLISQSKSKQFYQEYENLTAVGICANNIARIHMKNKRYLEAMNEQEESLMLANQEIEESRSYKRLILQLSSKDNFFQAL